MSGIAVSPQWLPDWLPRLTEAGLVLLAAWLVAGWLTGTGVEHSVQGTAGPDADMQLPDTSAIASFPLFGKQAVAPKPVVAAKPVAAAPARLNIRLLGTVVAGDRSYAVMKLGAGEEQVVLLGSDIQPGVVLKEIQSDAIVVDNRGRREKVLMARGNLSSSASPNTAAMNANAPAMMPPAAMPEGPDQRSFTREEIQGELNDLPRLLTGALAVPHQTNGNPDGFLIQDIVPGSLYEKAGLQNGDVVRSVNGEMITTPEKGIALFQALQSAKSLNLEITRAGAAQQLHFDIR